MATAPKLPMRVTWTATWPDGHQRRLTAKLAMATQQQLDRHADSPDESLDGLWLPKKKTLYLLDETPNDQLWDLFFHELDHAYTDWKREVRMKEP